MANISSAEPGSKGTLIFESLLLPRNRPLEALPTVKKDVIKSGAATTFHLWKTECDMHEPLPLNGLQSSPGIYSDPGAATPSDALTRYGVDYVCQITRRGRSFATKEQVEQFMEHPKKE